MRILQTAIWCSSDRKSQKMVQKENDSNMNTDFNVYERWQLRNKSIAIITQRNRNIAVGCIDDSDAVHTWVSGETRAGKGYDLVKLLEKR